MSETIKFLLSIWVKIFFLFTPFFALSIEKALGKRGLNILSKIAGLVLAALAAQMILTGVKHFLQQ